MIMIDSLVRPNIRKLTPYSSARSLYQTGVFHDANENAIGSTVEIPGYPDLNRYPDPFSRELRAALAEYVQVNQINIFVGNGADEAIDLLIRVFVNADEEILIQEPTYGMYRVTAETAGVGVRSCPLDANFQIDTEMVLRSVTSKTKIIFCCSPNNPTGNCMRPEDVRTLCKRFRGIVVLDEAYIEFAQTPSLAPEIERLENLVILRTFSKAWGLAGVRVGYVVANQKIIEYLNKVKLPYNLNRVSSCLALKALGRKETMLKVVKRINRERECVARKFEAIGIHVFPSDANFILVTFPGASGAVRQLAQESQIIVRDMSGNGVLRDCVRISIGTPTENSALLQALLRYRTSL
jgi:histidinol-phosphate aminotransferase